MKVTPVICGDCLWPDCHHLWERKGIMNKELKELDEAITYLWWAAEISDATKLWWNDHYKLLIERELAK
jgi:hypothetical protein